MSKKLMIQKGNSISLNDSETVNLASLRFDLKQFKLP